MRQHLTGELRLSSRDKHEEMKRAATRRGRNEASVSVHPVLKFKKNVYRRAEVDAELQKGRTDRKREERQLEPLKFSFI